MCGTVGLFVGCDAMVDCPLQALRASRSTSTAPSDDDDYRSAFGSWYERSSVRSSPRRKVDAGDRDRLPFRPALVPVASHPLVAGLPEERFRDVLLRHMYRYLGFTTILESDVVNPHLRLMSKGGDGLRLPREMRLDALKMYCDEAYHTLFSVDLVQQMEDLTKTRAADEPPYFLERLRALRQDVDSWSAGLVTLLFVAVSETLISATLAARAGSDEVVEAINGSIRDHAVDEGRHHAFFAAYIKRLLGQLEPTDRRRALRLVPRLVEIFLEPDLAGVRRDLGAQGLSVDATEQVLEETFQIERLRKQWRTMAGPTLSYFAAFGEADGQAHDELHELGLAWPTDPWSPLPAAEHDSAPRVPAESVEVARA
jgi:hypothetical protein